MTHGERVAEAGAGAGQSVLSALTIALIACMSEVDGERASSGRCPEDEVCSEATNQGLRFISDAFWDDDEELLLGPVLRFGSTFEIGLKTVDGEPLADFDIEVDDGHDLLRVERGEGVFRTDDTERQGAASGGRGLGNISGIGSGSTLIRIVEPDTGSWRNRLRVEAYEIEDISITNMNDPQRRYVVAGSTRCWPSAYWPRTATWSCAPFNQSVQLPPKAKCAPSRSSGTASTTTRPRGSRRGLRGSRSCRQDLRARARGAHLGRSRPADVPGGRTSRLTRRPSGRRR